MSAALFDAVEFATRAHRGQYRKGSGFPYIIHPLAVAKTLLDHGCEEALVIAGLLHDTVEDTPVTLGEVREQFGARVADLVEGVSEPDKSASWEERKQQTIEAIATAPLDVLLVECADKLDNIRCIQTDCDRVGDVVWDRFHRPRHQQQWYYQSLARELLRRAEGEPSTTLFRKFSRAVEQVFGASAGGTGEA